eukprot:2409358-Pleurochrysis_carterae.AAC.2
MRAARYGTRINAKAIEFGEGPHVRHAVAAKQLAALCLRACCLLEPLQLLQLAPEAASVVDDRRIERPSCVRSRHVAACNNITYLALLLLSSWQLESGFGGVLPCVAVGLLARCCPLPQHLGDGNPAADSEIGLQDRVLIAADVKDHVAGISRAGVKVEKEVG